MERARAYVLDECNKKHVKAELEAVTKYAVEELNAFGAPLMLVEDGAGGAGKAVFGSDRMEVVAMLLGEKYYGARPKL